MITSHIVPASKYSNYLFSVIKTAYKKACFQSPSHVEMSKQKLEGKNMNIVNAEWLLITQYCAKALLKHDTN